MQRKALDELIAWKENPNKKALLVRGCRQVGKTHLIKEFASKNYRSHLYINLEERDDLRASFESGDRTAKAIVDRLMFDSDVTLYPGESAIILDEIQSCLPAYSSLKSLVTDTGFDIIASGSLLGVRIEDLQQLSPMGYVDIIDLRPLDFEEFLWAMGVNKDNTQYLRDCIQNMRSIDGYICKQVTELFLRYMVVGGMPAAVKSYSIDRDYSKVRKVLKNILSLLSDDVGRYSMGTDRMRITACLESIPNQLSNERKGFRYIDIEKRKGGHRLYGPALLWLKYAGLIEFCHNLEEPVAPLENRVRDNIFKVYMLDSGLLTAMMDDGAAGTVVNRDPYVNNGAIMENAIACSLRSSGYDLRYYSKDDSTLEVDFILNIGGTVTAMEVKSGRNKKAKSLSTLFTKNRTVARAIKVSDGNVFMDENGIENLPLFGPCFIGRSDEYLVPPVDDMDGLIQRFDEMRES